MTFLEIILVFFAIIISALVLILSLIFIYYFLKYKNVNSITKGKRSIESMSRDEILARLNIFWINMKHIKVLENKSKQIPPHNQYILIINIIRFDLESITESYIENYLIPVLMKLELYQVVSKIKESGNKKMCIKENLIVIEDALVNFIRVNISLYDKNVPQK